MAILEKELSARKPPIPQPDMDLMHIPLENIRPSQSNPRGLFEQEALESLAASIAAHGVLEPIIVREITNGLVFMEDAADHYAIIAGERRFRAAHLAGLASIPALVKDVDSDADALVMTLIENLQREQLNPMEAARGYQQLTEMGYTQERIVNECGGSVSSVSNTMRLLRLPYSVQKMIRDGRLSFSHGKILVGVMDRLREGQVIDAALTAAHNGYSVRAMEGMIETRHPKPAPPPTLMDTNADLMDPLTPQGDNAADGTGGAVPAGDPAEAVEAPAGHETDDVPDVGASGAGDDPVPGASAASVRADDAAPADDDAAPADAEPAKPAADVPVTSPPPVSSPAAGLPPLSQFPNRYVFPTSGGHVAQDSVPEGCTEDCPCHQNVNVYGSIVTICTDPDRLTRLKAEEKAAKVHPAAPLTSEDWDDAESAHFEANLPALTSVRRVMAAEESVGLAAPGTSYAKALAVVTKTIFLSTREVIIRDAAAALDLAVDLDMVITEDEADLAPILTALAELPARDLLRLCVECALRTEIDELGYGAEPQMLHFLAPSPSAQDGPDAPETNAEGPDTPSPISTPGKHGPTDEDRARWAAKREADTQDAGLIRALHHVAGADERLQEMRESGVSDRDLKIALGEMLDDGGSSGPGQKSINHRGGISPAFWFDCGRGINEPPTLKGVALVAEVRRVMNLPYPAPAVPDVPTEGEKNGTSEGYADGADMACAGCGGPVTDGAFDEAGARPWFEGQAVRMSSGELAVRGRAWCDQCGPQIGDGGEPRETAADKSEPPDVNNEAPLCGCGEPICMGTCYNNSPSDWEYPAPEGRIEIGRTEVDPSDMDAKFCRSCGVLPVAGSGLYCPGCDPLTGEEDARVTHAICNL